MLSQAIEGVKPVYNRPAVFPANAPKRLVKLSQLHVRPSLSQTCVRKENLTVEILAYKKCFPDPPSPVDNQKFRFPGLQITFKFPYLIFTTYDIHEASFRIFGGIYIFLCTYRQ
jgi:hypothetical protein